MPRKKRAEGSIKTVGPNKHRLTLFIGYVPHPDDPIRKRRRRYHKETVYGSLDDAQARLAELVSHKRNKRFKAFNLKAVAADEYFRDWLNNIDPLNVRKSTHRAHVSMMDNYVLPAFGRRRLRSITAKDVDNLVQALLSAGKSRSTVRYCLAMLSQALEKARKLGLVEENPVRDVTRPTLRPSRAKPYDSMELMRFLIAALENKQHAALMFLLATTSIRPSEAFALRWSDVDLAAGIVRVERSVVRFKGGYEFAAPKTARGNRAILLSGHTAYVLASWYRRQAPVESNTLVFPNTKGEPLHGAHVYHKVFEPIVARAGLPKKRMYDLRHSHASHLAAQNVSPRVVSDRLGHASSVLTLDVYTGVSAEMQRSAADATEEMFGEQFRIGQPQPRVSQAELDLQQEFDDAFWAFIRELLGTDAPPSKLEDLLYQ